jgi:hypothetical protein
MITVEGAVPYPGWVDSRPIREVASAMRSLSRSMTEGAAGIRDTARSSAGSWSGPTADRFAAHTSARSNTVDLLAEVASEAVAVVDAYAAAIESSQEAYSAAANIELKSRPYLPATFAVVETAMAAEVAAIVALGVAGTVFAAALSGLMLKAEAADTFGITRNPYEVLRDTVNGIVDAWNNDDFVTSIVRGANTTGTTENADGSVTQFNILGLTISSNFGPWVKTLEVVGGVIGLLNATPLTIRKADQDLKDLEVGGFQSQPKTVSELGNNLALTEEYQRAKGIEPDQSSVIPYSIGIGPDGRRVITMHVPGIVPPGKGSVDGNSGERNITGAGLSEVTGLGTVETALRQQLENLGVKRGDQVVLYGHSYGGIIARNTANGLAREGIRSAFVSYGAPDGPLERGVEAFMVQNPNDPVPAARVGGDGMEGARYERNQHVILVHQRATGDLFNNHAARFYGENLTKTPNLELKEFLQRQNQVKLSQSGMVILEGPQTPAGESNTGREPYRLQPPVPVGAH